MTDPVVKLALVMRDFDGGGAERSMINLANTLAQCGTPVSLMVFRAEGAFAGFVDPRVDIVDLDTPVTGLATALAIPLLARALHRCGATHLVTTLESTTIVAHYARRLIASRPAWLIRVATTFSREPRPALRDRLIRRTYAGHSGPFVVNSQGSKRDLVAALELDPSRVTVINNAVDLESTERLAQAPPEQIRGLEPEDDFILTAGRLTQAKSQDVLLTAFAQLESRPRLKLVVLGEGPLRNSLGSLAEHLGIADRVIMPGFVTNPFAFMARAKAFVLSSSYEGMPSVLIEAMACGCQVISTDCPSGPAEILEGGKWGTLVPVADPTALRIALENLLACDHAHPNVRGRAAQFSLRNMGEAYLQVLAG